MSGRISKPISSLIGLGQEAVQRHKDQKAAQTSGASNSGDAKLPNANDDPPPYSSDEEDDEDLWIEDDAQDHIKQEPEEKKGKNLSVEEWVDAFVQRHPLHKTPSSRLPAPVLLPQKRPGTRTRGFVKAYAPALEEVGIDQKAWLEVIDGVHDSFNKQGYFNVTNIAIALSVLTYTISVAPSIIVHATAFAVHTSIEAGRRLYISKKTNSYLDEMNTRYFQPRGLYAMVMKYDPSSKEASEVMDFEAFSVNAISKHTADHQNVMRQFKGSSGKTPESQFPDVCPLVFPYLDSAPPEQQEKGFKAAVAFARDYGDRRTQATFASQNPDSKLNVEQKPFAGKYADPTTFQHSGLIGVLTGGAVDPKKRRYERRQRKQEITGRRGLLRGDKSLVRSAVQGARKNLRQGVLYLMVVNMPTEEEMRVAAEMEDKMKAEQPNWFEKFQASMKN